MNRQDIIVTATRKISALEEELEKEKQRAKLYKKTKLYIVSTVEYSYGEYYSVVVSADNGKEAVYIAESLLPGDCDKYNLELIGYSKNSKSAVVHSSFNAG